MSSRVGNDVVWRVLRANAIGVSALLFVATISTVLFDPDFWRAAVYGGFIVAVATLASVQMWLRDKREGVAGDVAWRKLVGSWKVVLLVVFAVIGFAYMAMKFDRIGHESRSVYVANVSERVQIYIEQSRERHEKPVSVLLQDQSVLLSLFKDMIVSVSENELILACAGPVSADVSVSDFLIWYERFKSRCGSDV